MRSMNGLVAGLLLMSMVSFGPFGGAENRIGDAQIADYLYEVLPGLHDGRIPIDPTLTTNWRLNSRGTTIAIDMDIAGVESNGLPVYASCQKLSPDPNVKARVNRVVAGGEGCREVVVSFFYGNDSQPLGEVSYLHVPPNVQAGAEIPVISGAGTRLGSLAESPWLRLTGPDADAIIALAGNVGSRRIEGPFEVVFEGRSLSIIRIGGGDDDWHYLGPLSDFSDGSRCASTGAHLHQAVPVSSGDPVWRNVDRPNSVNDDGFGFPGGNPYSAFCSDTWVYRLQSSFTAPEASPVEPCGAPQSAPSNLRALPRDGQLVLDWADPADDRITSVITSTETQMAPVFVPPSSTVSCLRNNAASRPRPRFSSRTRALICAGPRVLAGTW